MFRKFILITLFSLSSMTHAASDSIFDYIDNTNYDDLFSCEVTLDNKNSPVSPVNILSVSWNSWKVDDQGNGTAQGQWKTYSFNRSPLETTQTKIQLKNASTCEMEISFDIKKADGEIQNFKITNKKVTKWVPLIKKNITYIETKLKSDGEAVKDIECFMVPSCSL